MDPAPWPLPQSRDQLVGFGGDAVDHHPEIGAARHDGVEVHFPLRGGAGIDQRGRGVTNELEKLQACLGRHDELASAASRFCRFSPLMISARVAGVPIPLASFSRSRIALSSTKRQAFCMASINVPSL